MEDPVTIPVWLRLDDLTTTSGKLQDLHLDLLAELGVTRVIDLAPRDHPEALADEGEKCAARGMAYYNVEIPFNAPDEEHYRQFVEALELDHEKVHVHCIANWRASSFFYRYHLEHGMPEEEARAMLWRVWAPDETDHPTAAPWREFVTRAREAAARRSAA